MIIEASTKVNYQGWNNNNAPGVRPADASGLTKENVGYFYASNLSVINQPTESTTKLYEDHADYSPDVLPIAKSTNEENPYANRCNGYTNAANVWGWSAAIVEGLTLIQEKCNAYSNIPRENVRLTSDINEDDEIRVLANLYKTINNEILQRKLNIESIQESFLKKELAELSSFKLLFDKLDEISALNKSSIHTKLDTGSTSEDPTYISADSVILADFDDSLSNLISVDKNTDTLYDNMNVLRNDCICYSDCNAYYVCYCYGNCYYY